MSTDFAVKVLTPGKTLCSKRASEVVLPAYDGEVGVLANHADFVGLLGTGVLKVVSDGNDYWFMVSSGLYQIQHGELVVMAEYGEEPSAVNRESGEARLKEIEVAMADSTKATPETLPVLKKEYDQIRARLEIDRRTNIVN